MLRRRVALMSRTVTTPTAIPGPTVSGTVISGTGVSVTTLGIPAVGNNPTLVQGPTAIMPAGAGAISPSTVPVPSPASAGPMGSGITATHGQPGLGMKPGSGHSPSPNVLQVVKQVSYNSL